MDRTSIQDFQIYHNPHTLPHGEKPSAHDCPIESIEPYTDDDEAHSPSAPHSSDPDEAVFDHPSHPSSPATSRHSDDDNISILASEHYDPLLLPDRRISSPFTPLKTRSPFRNPSSIRALQMETTPPPYLISPSSQQRYRFTPSPSRNGTPQSTRSMQRSPSKLSPAKKVKKEYPLVLLHVTLLPPAMPYSAGVMTTVLPPSILSNLKLLREKSTPTVLSRGILIPHPREDYDLLEERLLESLELTLPRILKCGHFHLDPEAEADLIADEEDDDVDSDLDADICADCGRRVRDARLGSGTGARRWDIKIYAANGLMRAGAWSAAWREMERVDVEISPWIGDDLRRDLEVRRDQEEEEEEELGREDRPSREEQHEEGRDPGLAIPSDLPAATTPTRHPTPTHMHHARLREIYGPDAQALVDGLPDPNPNPTPSPRPPHRPRAPPRTPPPPRPDLPLRDVLKHYLLLAARDRRNVAIVVLALSVLLLSLGTFATTTTTLTPAESGAVAVLSSAADAGADAVAMATSAVVGVADAGAVSAVAGGGADAVARATSAVVGVGVGVADAGAEATAAAGDVVAAVRRGVGVVQEVLGGDVEGAGEMEMD